MTGEKKPGYWRYATPGDIAELGLLSWKLLLASSTGALSEMDAAYDKIRVVYRRVQKRKEIV